MALSAVGVVLATCGYDDSDLKSDIEDLQDRVSTLESYCVTLNSQVSSIQSVVDAIESGIFVSEVTALLNEDGSVTGYTITFNDNSTITLSIGTDGTNGTDGTTPVIGVVLVNGIYYWTLNGVPISGSDGEMIPVTAADGETGIIPQLKIEDGYWYVSYDNGDTWELVGEVYDDGSIDYITNFEEDDYYVYITLYDGTVLTLEKDIRLDITFSLPTVGFSEGGESVDVSYTITGYDSKTGVQALASDGYSAYVTPNTVSDGVITITAPDGCGDSEVLVLVSNTTKMILRIITISSGDFIAATSSSVTVSAEGGEVSIPVGTTVDYSVSIPDDCDWLTYTETRTMRVDTLVFTAEANHSLDSRYTVVTLTSTDSNIVETVLVTQEAIEIVLNDNWDVDYFGKYYSATLLDYYDRIIFTDEDGTRYLNMVYSADMVDNITLDSLFRYQQAYIDRYIAMYDPYYYDGYYIENVCYDDSEDLLYNSLESGTYYYAFMFGVEDDGSVTGKYQVSDKFTPETLGTGSDAYNSWLGVWNYTDNDKNTGTLTFSELEPDVSYLLVQNGTLGFWDVEVDFNSDGTVTSYSYETDGSGVTDEGNEYTVYWWGKIYVESTETTYIVTGDYQIADFTMDSSGRSATIEGATVTLSVGAGYATYMGYTGYGTTGHTHSIYFTYAPMIALPATLSYSYSINSLSSSNATNRTSEIMTDRSTPLLNYLRPLKSEEGYSWNVVD